MVDWPIDLTEAEAGAGARHAIQFPVMEQLGLVHSTIVAVPKSSENPDGAVKRFELTDAGRKFYKPHASAARGAEQQQPANDFCVAHLKREQIVDVKVDASNAQHPMAVVSYTYQIDTAPWMQDAERAARVPDGRAHRQRRGRQAATAPGLHARRQGLGRPVGAGLIRRNAHEHRRPFLARPGPLAHAQPRCRPDAAGAGGHDAKAGHERAGRAGHRRGLRRRAPAGRADAGRRHRTAGRGAVQPVARLAPGTRILAADREIVVHSRGEDPVFAALGNVVDADECKALIEMAKPRLAPSTLVDPMSGRDVVSDKRASWGMFFRLGENDLVARLDRRLSALMNLPLENGEGLQLLYYPTGAGSEPHHDYLAPTNAANRESIARSGQRVSTLVTYLNDVPDGGQTVFRNWAWPFRRSAAMPATSSTATTTAASMRAPCTPARP
jgi:hypothetical protein